jgi:hypothetical protein
MNSPEMQLSERPNCVLAASVMTTSGALGPLHKINSFADAEVATEPTNSSARKLCIAPVAFITLSMLDFVRRCFIVCAPVRLFLHLVFCAGRGSLSKSPIGLMARAMPTYLAMMSINSCSRCGTAVAACACGFLATLAVAILGDGKPPPSRTAAALASATTPMAPAGPTGGGTVTYSQPFFVVDNQVTGEKYVGIWRDVIGVDRRCLAPRAAAEASTDQGTVDAGSRTPDSIEGRREITPVDGARLRATSHPGAAARIRRRRGRVDVTGRRTAL